jgi:hypothetical protein
MLAVVLARWSEAGMVGFADYAKLHFSEEESVDYRPSDSMKDCYGSTGFSSFLDCLMAVYEDDERKPSDQLSEEHILGISYRHQPFVTQFEVILLMASVGYLEKSSVQKVLTEQCKLSISEDLKYLKAAQKLLHSGLLYPIESVQIEEALEV